MVLESHGKRTQMVVESRGKLFSLSRANSEIIISS